MGISFSNGTTPDAAVSYGDARALCGSGGTGVALNNPANANNFRLPINAPGCTQRISMNWVAAVSNQLAFLVDRAGLTFGPNSGCDDPLLTYNAVLAIVNANTQKIVTNQNLYVDTAGNDAADGLTPQTAKKTILAAAQLGVRSFNFVNLTINLVSPGQYDSPNPMPQGSGTISIVGNSQNQANYIITGPGNGQAILSLLGSAKLVGVTIRNATSDGTSTLAVLSGGVVGLQNVSLVTTIAGKSGGAQILNFGFINPGAGTNTQGDAGSLISSTSGATVLTPNCPVTIIGNATYSQATISLNKLASFDLNGASLVATGNVTGNRYLAALNSVFAMQGAGANAIPGSSAGNLISGGQYA